ncbi:MAG: hypothetical protein GY799_18870, partial [Desulfobulbaceae bacterium]|nr:hypothetical protein [Desulfobulbaceae bacterium]
MKCTRKILIRSLIMGVLAVSVLSSAVFAAVPVTWTSVVDGQLTVRLTKESFRASNFDVLIQNDQGDFDAFVPDEVRTFMGTVDEDPFACAMGYYRPDGVMQGRIYTKYGLVKSFEDNVLIYEQNWTGGYSYPTAPTVGAGRAGTTMYQVGIGVDIDSNGYEWRCNSDPDTAVERVEMIHLEMAQAQMQDFLIKPVLRRLVIRGSVAQDPYEGTSGTALLPLVGGAWAAVVPATEAFGCFKEALLTPDIGGGVAYCPGTASVSQFTTGGWSNAYRHEIGHNWGPTDYDGGSPEGNTIMCGNVLNRYCGTSVQDALNHRDQRMSLWPDFFTSLGTYTTIDIPPYAALDSHPIIFMGKSVTVDVVANDFDANGDSLSLLSFDAQTALGGTVQRSAGTGPDGRDELIYTAPFGAFGTEGVTDWFNYTIQDSSGQNGLGVVILKVKEPDPGVLDVVSDLDLTNVVKAVHWSNNSTLGTPATDITIGGVTFLAGPFNGTVDGV